MDTKLAAILALRGLVLTLRAQSLHDEADAVNAVILAHQAGRNVDAHMKEVADALEEGAIASWPEITARIQSETEEFLSRVPDGE